MSEPLAIAINKQLKKLLVWIPLILFFCSVISVAIIVRGIYDNDVAKHSDIDKINARLDNLDVKIEQLTVDIRGQIVDAGNVKADLTKHVTYADEQFKAIRRQLSQIERPRTLHYPIDANGKRIN